MRAILWSRGWSQHCAADFEGGCGPKLSLERQSVKEIQVMHAQSPVARHQTPNFRNWTLWRNQDPQIYKDIQQALPASKEKWRQHHSSRRRPTGQIAQVQSNWHALYSNSWACIYCILEITWVASMEMRQESCLCRPWATLSCTTGHCPAAHRISTFLVFGIWPTLLAFHPVMMVPIWWQHSMNGMSVELEKSLGTILCVRWPLVSMIQITLKLNHCQKPLMESQSQTDLLVMPGSTSTTMPQMMATSGLMLGAVVVNQHLHPLLTCMQLSVMAAGKRFLLLFSQKPMVQACRGGFSQSAKCNTRVVLQCSILIRPVVKIVLGATVELINILLVCANFDGSIFPFTVSRLCLWWQDC